MAVCSRCGGSGRLQAGWSDSGQSRYMTCEVCGGTGRTGTSGGSPTTGPHAGCAVALAALALAASSLAAVVLWCASLLRFPL
jgi:hypothetical protein